MTLITQLSLSLQWRPDADMGDFFRFKNQIEPPNLADRGFLRSGTKTRFLQCLDDPTGRAAAAKQAAVVVMGMAAVIYMVSPTTAKTFSEYVPLYIVPFLEAQMNQHTDLED